MFGKKKKTEEEIITLPPIEYCVGEPELSSGKVFWPIYKIAPYVAFTPFVLSTYISGIHTKIAYCESKEDAERYINELKATPQGEEK